MAETKDFTVRMIIQPIIEQIENLTKPIEEAFKTGTEDLEDNIEKAAKRIEKSFKQTTKDLKDVEATFGKGLQEIFAGAAKGGEEGGVVGMIVGAIEALSNILGAIAPELIIIAGLLIILGGMIGAIMEPIGKGIMMIVDILAMPFKILGTMMLVRMLPFFDLAIKLSNVLLKFFLDLEGKEGESTPLDIFGGAITGLAGLVDLLTGAGWDRLAEGSKSFVEGIISLASMFGSLLPFVMAGSLGTAIGEALVNFVGGIVGWFTELDIWGAMSSIWDEFARFVGGIVGWFVELGVDIWGVMGDIWAKFNEFITKIMDWFTLIIPFVWGEAGKIWREFTAFVKKIVDWFVTNTLSISTELSKIWEAFTDFVDGVVDWFKEALNKITGGGSTKGEEGNKEREEDFIGEIVKGTEEVVRNLLGAITGAASGGFVRESGIAVIHKGETITPNNANINSGLENAFQSFKTEGTDPLIDALRTLTEEIGRNRETGTLLSSSTRNISAMGPQPI